MSSLYSTFASFTPAATSLMSHEVAPAPASCAAAAAAAAGGGSAISDWLAVALTAAAVSTGGNTGQLQGPLPLMQVQSTAQVAAAAAVSVSGPLRRVQRVVSELDRFASACGAW